VQAVETEYKAPGTANDTGEMTEVKLAPGEEIIQDDEFKYDGYQVVRGEFFAHIREPSITFNNHKVSLNTACLNRLPTVDYVQILVNPNELKLVVRPSSEDEKDSFIWCTKGEKRKPKQVTCRVFFAKIMDLMDWNPEHRYKLLGKLIRSGDEFLFTFDLTAMEVYQWIVRDGEKPRSSRTPVFSAEWQNQFGLPVEEHRKRLQVNIFKGYTVFSVKDAHETEPPPVSAEPQTEERIRHE
jgi:hypothetical protein